MGGFLPKLKKRKEFEEGRHKNEKEGKKKKGKIKKGTTEKRGKGGDVKKRGRVLKMEIICSLFPCLCIFTIER